LNLQQQCQLLSQLVRGNADEEEEEDIEFAQAVMFPHRDDEFGGDVQYHQPQQLPPSISRLRMEIEDMLRNIVLTEGTEGHDTLSTANASDMGTSIQGHYQESLDGMSPSSEITRSSMWSSLSLPDDIQSVHQLHQNMHQQHQQSNPMPSQLAGPHLTAFVPYGSQSWLTSSESTQFHANSAPPSTTQHTRPAGLRRVPSVSEVIESYRRQSDRSRQQPNSLYSHLKGQQ
jgi:hypothetical protein